MLLNLVNEYELSFTITYDADENVNNIKFTNYHGINTVPNFVKEIFLYDKDFLILTIPYPPCKKYYLKINKDGIAEALVNTMYFDENGKPQEIQKSELNDISGAIIITFQEMGAKLKSS